MIEQVAAIFDREIARAEDNYEPSEFVAWLTGLKSEVLDAVNNGGDQ